MKTLTHTLFRVICGVVLTLSTVTLTADEVAAPVEKNVVAGYATEGQQPNLPAVPPAGTDAKSKKEKVAKRLHPAAKALLSTSHPGGLHTSVSFTANGDEIILEDGSVWEVNKEDTYKVMHWSSTDQVVITPNDDFFSKYDHNWRPKFIFRIANTKLQISVAVRLKTFISPIYHSVYNHRLASYNDYERMIWLEDGSAWRIDSWDFEICKKWAIGHTLIIGINDGFLASWSPNILICGDRNEFVRCKCEN